MNKAYLMTRILLLMGMSRRRPGRNAALRRMMQSQVNLHSFELQTGLVEIPPR